MAGQRIEREAVAHHCAQSINRAEIGGARRQVDADGGRERQHAARSAVTAARTRSAEAPTRTWSRSPVRNTTSIAGASTSGATCTGTNVGGAADVTASLRHQYQNVHVGM